MMIGATVAWSTQPWDTRLMRSWAPKTALKSPITIMQSKLNLQKPLTIYLRRAISPHISGIGSFMHLMSPLIWLGAFTLFVTKPCNSHWVRSFPLFGGLLLSQLSGWFGLQEIGSYLTASHRIYTWPRRLFGRRFGKLTHLTSDPWSIRRLICLDFGRWGLKGNHAKLRWSTLFNGNLHLLDGWKLIQMDAREVSQDHRHAEESFETAEGLYMDALRFRWAADSHIRQSGLGLWRLSL